MDNNVIVPVIKECYEDLKNLPISFVPGRLWSKEVISLEEKVEIEAGSNDFVKCTRLSETLLKKDNNALNTLITILQEDNAHRRLVQILQTSRDRVLAVLRGTNNPPPPIATGNTAEMGDPVSAALQSRQITTPKQIGAVAKTISDDDEALTNIKSIAANFLDRATDRANINRMCTNGEPFLEIVRQILNSYRSSKGTPTLGNVALLLEESGLDDLAGKVRVMELPG